MEFSHLKIHKINILFNAENETGLRRVPRFDNRVDDGIQRDKDGSRAYAWARERTFSPSSELSRDWHVETLVMPFLLSKADFASHSQVYDDDYY